MNKNVQSSFSERPFLRKTKTRFCIHGYNAFVMKLTYATSFRRPFLLDWRVSELDIFMRKSFT